MGFLSNIGLGGAGGGYTSGDGLVNIPGLAPEDALNGLRSVVDFRHIYGGDASVPNINFGGQMVSGKLPGSAVDAPKQTMQPSAFRKAMEAFGNGMQQMGQVDSSAPQSPAMNNDAMSILRGLGIDLTRNHLGRLGQG